MARKGNQQKNGLDHNGLKQKKAVTGSALPGVKGHTKCAQVKVFPGDEIPNGNHQSSLSKSANETTAVNGNNIEQKREKFPRREKQGMVIQQDQVESLSRSNSEEVSQDTKVPIHEENGTSRRSNQGQQNMKSRMSFLLDSFHIKSVVEKVNLANINFWSFRLWISTIFTRFTGWLIRHKPFFLSLAASIFKACDHCKMKILKAYPIVLKWLLHFGNIMLLLLVLWLDCALRGIDSFVRMGTASFFSVIWCSMFSVISMIGMLKFIVILVSLSYSC